MKRYLKQSRKKFYVMVGFVATLLSAAFTSSVEKREGLTLQNDVPDLSYIKEVYADVSYDPYIDPYSSYGNGDHNGRGNTGNGVDGNGGGQP